MPDQQPKPYRVEIPELMASALSVDETAGMEITDDLDGIILWVTPRNSKEHA